MTTNRPAITMRELRERLGHTIPPPGTPEPTITPTRYVISCLPEGHDERLTYTVQVGYRGNGLYSVRHTLKYADINGVWDYEPPALEDSSEADENAHETWCNAHRFDLDTALNLARKVAPLITYRGRTVADALAAKEVGP